MLIDSMKSSAAALILVGCLSCARAPIGSKPVDSAGDPTRDSASLVVADGLPGDDARAIDTALLSVVRLRGLEPVDPVVASGVTRERHIAFVNREASDPVNIRPLKVLEAFLKSAGSIPDDSDLVAEVTKFMIDDVAGYYDWDEKKLFVPDWIEMEFVSAVFAHELTHALQDQHFGLARIAQPVDGISEPFTAGLAVVEGDATMVMTAVELGDIPVSAAIVNGMTAIMDAEWDREAGGRADAMPAVVSDLLKFPYVDGLRYVGHLLNSAGGNWAAVDSALRKPPLSSEQIIHFDGAGRDDNPVNIRLDEDLIHAATFGGTDVMGEAGFRAIFRDVMPRGEADEAAAGWDGDRFSVWTNGAGGDLVVLASVWDSARDATQAAGALTRLRNVPAAVNVSERTVVAVWGPEPRSAMELSSDVAGKLVTVEICSWEDWLAEGRRINGSVDK